MVVPTIAELPVPSSVMWSSENVRAMVDAAARSPPAVLAAGQMRRFLFVNHWVKMLIEHGTLGSIESFDVREGECFHLRRVRGNPRAAAGTGQFSPAFWDRKTSGGGVRRLDLYAAKCVVRIDKARRLLGYEPEFDLERGMERTTRYVHWAYDHRVQGSPPRHVRRRIPAGRPRMAPVRIRARPRT